MGRRKKKGSGNGKQITIGILGAAIIGAGIYYGLQYWSPGSDAVDVPKPPSPSVPGDENPDDNLSVETPKPKEYVNVFFIGKNDNNEEVYKAVKRLYNKDVDGSKIKYAINSLILGPKPNEKEKGVYTEIPSGTQLLSVVEKTDKVIINLSGAYATGGGTESVYKRLYQLIKTAQRNTDKPVYLYINGHQADVIGGDGIMLNQPLNENSLDG